MENNDVNDNTPNETVIILEMPEDADVTAALRRLDGQAREEEGKGHSAQVAANKYRVEQGLVLLKHQPPKGKPGDPTRTNWQKERAKDLDCDERFVRYLIATADTMSKGGLERKVPIEILNRDFKRVRASVTLFVEHGDPDWKAPREDATVAGPERDEALRAKFHRLVQQVLKLAGEALDVGPENAFWNAVCDWLDSLPESLLSDREAQADETDDGKKEVTVTEDEPQDASDAQGIAPAGPETGPGALPRDTRIRLLAGKHKGCTAALGRYSPTYGYAVKEIADEKGVRRRGSAGESAKTWAKPGQRGKYWIEE